ncbi:hypothetical protein GCM10022223_57090 [Kineosporia mesophila]|uniref:Uncharacterized protein n=1 Tax=Kineosporia mesophila TaxID=566012 RepID=A0ABP7AGC3_9ACTN|nr:hypothetical protein [Kineosporia mesophila]MCD5350922.1 hypothetical protein [Kineosporia mesophila]
MPTSSAKVLPRPVALSVAGGLLLMTVFTLVWAGDTFIGWPAVAAAPFFAAAVIAGGVFTRRAGQLFRARWSFPAVDTEDDAAEGRRLGGAYGIVFGLEGAGIGIVAGVLSGSDYLLPAIALVVALHWYPMAWVFRRGFDLWPASWTLLVAVAGIVLLATGADRDLVWSWVGAGTALATLGYGTYMTFYGADLLASVT